MNMLIKSLLKILLAFLLFPGIIIGYLLALIFYSIYAGWFEFAKEVLWLSEDENETKVLKK